MRRYFRLLQHLILAITCALAISAVSSPLAAETDFPISPGRAAFPMVITMGPDHNLWFTENSGLKIGTINPLGVITEYPIAGAQGLLGITTGPDGNIWFTDEFAGFIGHINTSGGSLVTYDLPLGSHPQGIVAGLDGKLWFVDNSVDLLHPMEGFRVGSIDTSGNINEYPTGIDPIVFDGFDYAPAEITVDPHGNLWFTNPNAQEIGVAFVGEITPAGVVSICNTNSFPQGIITGPDGNIWTIESVNVAKIVAPCTETDYPLSVDYGYAGMTTGPDGNIWFTEYNSVGYVTPAGVVNEFSTSLFQGDYYLSSIASGSDGALWIVASITSGILRFTTSGQLTNTYNLNVGSQPAWDALGSDGNIWATQSFANAVSKITPSGVITTIPTAAGADPGPIVAGPDGNLWFVETGTYKIAKITTQGVITEFPVGQTNPGLSGITAGPDGNLWFTENSPAYNNIVRITTDGVMTPFQIPTPKARAFFDTAGPDGNIWFTEYGTQKVANINLNNFQITEYPYPGNNKPLFNIVTGPDANLWIMVATPFGAIAKFSTSGSLLAEYAAQFQTSLLGIEPGPDGALWFAQYYPDGISRITTSGVLSTVQLSAANVEGNAVAVGADHKLWIPEVSAGAMGRLSAIGGTGFAISPMAGTQFNGAVASFVDGTPSATQANFTSTIDWGDGTGPTPGTVSGPTGGPFTVSGTHTYSSPGAYAVNVSLSDTVDNSTYQASPGTAHVTSSQVNYVLTGSISGGGTVASTDGDISCPGTCGYSYPANTPVTLNATATPGWSFVGWSGACSGTGSCNVIMTGTMSVTATFTQNAGFFNLTVSTKGSGTVTSTDGFISCPTMCTHTYASNTPVTLNATPGQGGTFSGWSGACTGTGSCNVTMTQNLSLKASFTSQQDMLLHSFGSGNDGENPVANLISDSAGNLYGTTSGGGTNREGTVFKLSSNGTETVLHNFGSGNDGQTPLGSLIFDSAGNLYGTTSAGGLYGFGMVFELSPDGTETVLYNFGSGTDGQNPNAGMVFDSSGNLYGTTVNGGLFGGGTAFELSPNSGGSWTETGLYSFGGTPSDGVNPYSALIFDSSGNLYGTTTNGGAYNGGTVFELIPSGAGIGCCRESPLYSFGNGGDGSNPHAGLVFDSSGNLYGTTVNGGTYGGGTAFELSLSGGTWTESGLYSFGNGSDGKNPYAGLIVDKSGNLYGTTLNGGLYGGGMLFELLPSRIGCCRENPLYSFGNGNDGRNPQAGLVFNTAGTLYGTTVNGGEFGGGTVFGITRSRITSLPSSSAIK